MLEHIFLIVKPRRIPIFAGSTTICAGSSTILG